MHVTERGEVARASLPDAEARAIRAEWRAFWFVHRADYVPFDGSTKLAASLSETQYARWVVGSLAGRFGVHPRAGRPILEVAVDRARVTLPLALAALLGSLALGVPLGAIAAERKGRTVTGPSSALSAVRDLTSVVSSCSCGDGPARRRAPVPAPPWRARRDGEPAARRCSSVSPRSRPRGARARRGAAWCRRPRPGTCSCPRRRARDEARPLVGAAVVVEEVPDLRGLGGRCPRGGVSRRRGPCSSSCSRARFTAGRVSDVAQASCTPAVNEG